MKTAILALVLTVTPVFAQPNVPDEITKKLALQIAYELNGKSMVRWGSIDLSRNVLQPKPVAKGK